MDLNTLPLHTSANQCVETFVGEVDYVHSLVPSRCTQGLRFGAGRKTPRLAVAQKRTPPQEVSTLSETV